MSKEYVARAFVNEVLAEKQENGDWKATVRSIERRSEDNKEWEQVEVATSCTDKDFDNAYQVAMQATLEKFNDVITLNKNYSMFPDDSDVMLETVNEDVEEPVAV